MKGPSHIEILEAGIAPASVSVSFTDVDGDLVKITASKPGKVPPRGPVASLLRASVLASAVLFLGLISSPSAHGAPGDVDLSFDPGSGVDGTVHAIVVQPDGKVIIGGDFTTVKGLVRKGLARLNADGSGDSSFAPPPSLSDAESSSVSRLALQPNGKVIVTYYQYQSEIESYGLTRLNSDGSVDPAFHLDPEAISNQMGNNVLVQPDGKLLCNGDGIFRLNADGTFDDSFYSTVTGASLVTRQPDGKVIIVGRYGDLSLFVLRLETNGSIDPSFHAEIQDPSWVRSAVVQADGKLLLAGDRLRVNGNVTMIARFNSDGSADTTFGPVTSLSGFGDIGDVALQPDGKIVVGGRFHGLNGSTRNNLARLNANGTVDLSFPSGPGGGWEEVNTIAQDANGWILIVRGSVVRLHDDGSADPEFEPGGRPASLPLTMALAPDGKVLIGGYRSRPNSGGVILAPITRVDANGSRDNGFNPGAGPNSDVTEVASQPDGKVLIGGRFTSVNGTNRDALARLNADGSLEDSFNPPLAAMTPLDGVPPGYVGSYERAVTAIAVQADGKVVVAGCALTEAYNWATEDLFTTGRSFVFRFHANGTHDSSFAGGVGESGFFNPPTELAIQQDGKIVLAGHQYFSIVGSTRSGIARLNADGTLDASFLSEPRFNISFIHAIALQPDGKLVVAGYLSRPNGYANEVVRINANGSPDATFVPGMGPLGWVSEVAVQPDGKVLIGGEFTMFNGTPRNRIARLNANGSLDFGFNPGTGPDGNISALALQPDGRILIGGDFVTVNGILRPRVARLYGDSLPPPATFATWAASFGLSGALAAADLDPDRDGLASVLEYILGGNPAQPSPTTPRPTASLTGGSMLFIFSRTDASETPDVNLTVQSGSDLVTWPDVFNIGPDTAASSPGVTILENGTAPDTITVALPAGPGNARFARLRATVAP